MSAISSDGKTFSVDGRGAKYNSREDIRSILDGVDPALIEEVHFGGNTIGVDASLALAEWLQKASNIKVLLIHPPIHVSIELSVSRSLTLQMSSLED